MHMAHKRSRYTYAHSILNQTLQFDNYSYLQFLTDIYVKYLKSNSSFKQTVVIFINNNKKYEKSTFLIHFQSQNVVYKHLNCQAV